MTVRFDKTEVVGNLGHSKMRVFSELWQQDAQKLAGGRMQRGE